MLSDASPCGNLAAENSKAGSMCRPGITFCTSKVVFQSPSPSPSPGAQLTCQIISIKDSKAKLNDDSALIYKHEKSEHSKLFSPFDHIRYVKSFSQRSRHTELSVSGISRCPSPERVRLIPESACMAAYICHTKIKDDVKAEALLLSHNQGLCVVTGTQGTGGEEPSGTTELGWIYPPSIHIWVSHNQVAEGF